MQSLGSVTVKQIKNVTTHAQSEFPPNDAIPQCHLPPHSEPVIRPDIAVKVSDGTMQ